MSNINKLKAHPVSQEGDLFLMCGQLPTEEEVEQSYEETHETVEQAALKWHEDYLKAKTFKDVSRQINKPDKEVDTVNHPPHYTKHPSGVECITITEHMNFNVGNAVKYLWRADEKGKALEDLKKARWYIDREIKRRKLVL